MTVINGVNLTGDTLANIHIMAPMLDESARDKALAYMIGLITGAGHVKQPPEDGSKKS